MDKLQGFSPVHSNVRSLLTKGAEIDHYFRGFNIIGLSETWLTEKVDSSLLENYQIYDNIR